MFVYAKNRFGLSMDIGLSSALDTLASQAHGARQDHLACIYVQRARVLATLQLMWIVPLLCLCNRWLVYIGQDPDVATLAGVYTGASAPFLFVLVQGVAIEKLLAAFLRPKASAVTGLVCAIGHVVWCALFIGYLNLGMLGVALANGVTWFLRAVFLFGYACTSARAMGLDPIWVIGLQSEAFRGWSEYMKVALPALMQICGEWWLFEIAALIVGYLGANALAAHTATINVFLLLSVINISISCSSAMLVGNAMGAGNPALARRFAWLCVSLSMMFWTVLAVGTAICHMTIARAYSQDMHVQRVMRALLLILCIIGFPDSCQTTLSGVLRGLGKLKSASAIYFISFYLIELPVAVLVAFTFGCGVQGVWWAMGLGFSIAALSFALVVACTNFTQVASQIQNLISTEVEEPRSRTRDASDTS